jgi:glucose/arabinose dehydrogenase
VFPNRQDVGAASVFLDIRSRVDAHPAGRGLLGFAFDPNYRQNRELYVYYTATNPMRSVLSRFRASVTQPDQADPASEEILLTIDQPYQNHKGGQVAFGADGMLYLTSGDGGGGKAPDNGQKNGQDRKTLLGKFLRIDVHPRTGDRPYAIPSDNPFAGNREGFREEIYAYGLRNPWRAAFDAETGRWFGGDVGQMTLEEINLYEKGGNYGWALMEGTNCFGATDCDPSGLKQPIATYGRDMGFSVTGGYVYRGQRAPALRGAYIYADYVSGRFWALRHDGQRVTHNEVVLKADLSTTTFGQDAQRELYAVGSDGTIHRFR